MAAAVAVILCGCDWGLATRGGLVVNNTDQDLVIEPVGVSDANRVTIPARRAHQWNAFNECLGTALAVSQRMGSRWPRWISGSATVSSSSSNLTTLPHGNT